MTEESAFSGPEPRAVSLDLELSTLATATRGAEILADYQSRHGFLDEASEVDAPGCIMSILALVGGRLQQLRRVVRGEENPSHMRTPHNAITLPESLADLEGDIILFPWNCRGMPLVLARPTRARPGPQEGEKRNAARVAGLMEESKGPKGRKAKSPEGRKTKDRRERKKKELKDQAPQALSPRGTAPKEAPQPASAPT
jgi:hypothetical protein